MGIVEKLLQIKNQNLVTIFVEFFLDYLYSINSFKGTHLKCLIYDIKMVRNRY